MQLALGFGAIDTERIEFRDLVEETFLRRNRNHHASVRQQDRLTGTDLQAPGGVIAIVVLSAVVVAAVSLVLKPFSLLVLLALVWLLISRRRRADRKHEGLRVLR